MKYQNEKIEILKFIKRKVKALSKTTHKPIKFIQVGYDIDQSKLICLYFDSRPKAGPDGSWTINIKGNSKRIGKWAMFKRFNYNKLVADLGDLLKECMLELRKEEVFALIKCAKDCDFGIEHIEGEYGWPDVTAQAAWLFIDGFFRGIFGCQGRPARALAMASHGSMPFLVVVLR
jgi:hypothetical protein